MFALNLPNFTIKVIVRNGKKMVFDPLRRRYLVLTPEEWVRQNFIQFLIQHKNYPAALLANEVSLTLNNTAKRCDTVLFRRDTTPMMIVEYKAPSIPITQKVFEQISRYNMVMRVDYLVVSNGLEHYCCHMDYETRQCKFLHDIPSYQQLSTPQSE